MLLVLSNFFMYIVFFYQINIICVARIRQNSNVSRIGYVFDTGAGAIRVRYAHDTPTGVSEYSDNFDIFRYAPICPRYIHDIFSRYFGGFSQEYAPDTR
jgi:hypothetical protein